MGGTPYPLSGNVREARERNRLLAKGGSIGGAAGFSSRGLNFPERGSGCLPNAVPFYAPDRNATSSSNRVSGSSS